MTDSRSKTGARRAPFLPTLYDTIERACVPNDQIEGFGVQVPKITCRNHALSPANAVIVVWNPGKADRFRELTRVGLPDDAYRGKMYLTSSSSK